MRSTISITNVFLSVLFMLVALLHTGCFAFMKRSRNCLVHTFSMTRRTKLLSSFVFRQSWDLVDRRIRFATSVVSRSSSTLKREIGISLAITFPSSSSKMQSSSQISFTPVNRNRRRRFLKLNRHTTTSGIFKDSPPKLPIFSCGPCLTGIYLNMHSNVGGFHEVIE